ncbi:uncharacterized protein DSM5745_00233 [Aspergillus mulundensis]|uniref:Uncharacterized protein n=1 Tax=Aspergillus mulundensis TaxID=1810919 RepID=A0A3D8T382_9EURO|nr:hypothetical protein DSM5745_00233 [Aspergillus mulundensis]RDW92911.1 hypothetical protein DSM5745_00233 [Aspergillus mulundensis]
MEKSTFLTALWPSPRQTHRFQTIKTETSTADDDDDNNCTDSEGLLASSSRRTKTPARKPALSTTWICLTTANLAMMSITASVFLSAKLQGTGSGSGSSEKNAILRPVSWWSPILDAVEIPTYETTLNGTLFPLPEPSIARQEPGPDNDAAWAQYERILTTSVTRADILKLGKDPDTVARFDDAYWGLGDDAYMVQFDHGDDLGHAARQNALDPPGPLPRHPAAEPAVQRQHGGPDAGLGRGAARALARLQHQPQVPRPRRDRRLPGPEHGGRREIQAHGTAGWGVCLAVALDAGE